MPDVSQTLLQDLLQEKRFPDFPWQEGQVPPAYHGRSILNLPTTVARWLGARPLGVASALDATLTQGLDDQVRQVIVFLIDGFGWHIFQQARATGLLEAWEPFIEQGRLGVLTSIVPSTTAAAIPTLWTGRSPAEHGITGYEVWMKEYGSVVNMILYSPSFYQVGPGLLEKAGFDPDRFFTFPTLGTHLKQRGVEVRAFQHYTIANSGLSRMLFKDAEVHAFSALTDLWSNLVDFLEAASSKERRYIWVYWGLVDRFGHKNGPQDRRVLDEIRTILWSWQHFFLERFPKAQREGTVMVITADHGMMATPPRAAYEIKHHPKLMKYLLLPPTGENRFTYLYPKPGYVAALREYFATVWPEDFVLIPSRDLLRMGLLGPGKPHPMLPERVGYWVAIPRGEAYLWWANKENDLQGRHGGVSTHEMLVPFLAFRLDG